MRDLVKNVFLYLVAFLLFIIFLKNEHYLEFITFNIFVDTIVFILAIIVIVFVVRKLEKWMATIRFEFPIEVITSLLILFYFVHELFTPYFYPETYLKEVGVEKIEMYHQLHNSELSNKERTELAKDVVTRDMAVSFELGFDDRIYPIEEIEIIDFKRHFHEYELTIKGKHPKQEIGKTYLYTLTQVGMGFKIIGFASLD